jgi:toxin YhaV
MLLHPSLVSQLENLLATVGAERKRDPSSLSAAAKLLRAVVSLMFEEIPRDPTRAEFRLGKTLGDGRKHWFRAKFGGGRFRLFFRYRTDVRLIVYAWMNDENTLRAYGSRTDAYAVFGRMLDGGNPPDDWDGLVSTASTREAISRANELGTKLVSDR